MKIYICEQLSTTHFGLSISRFFSCLSPNRSLRDFSFRITIWAFSSPSEGCEYGYFSSDFHEFGISFACFPMNLLWFCAIHGLGPKKKTLEHFIRHLMTFLWFTTNAMITAIDMYHYSNSFWLTSASCLIIFHSKCAEKTVSPVFRAIAVQTHSFYNENELQASKNSIQNYFSLLICQFDRPQWKIEHRNRFMGKREI